MGGDVRSLHEKLAGGEGLPLSLVKRVMIHTLRGLAHTHRHADLRQDNILFDTALTQADIEALVEADRPRYRPPEQSWECTVQAAVSQPLPSPLLVEVMTCDCFRCGFWQL